MIRTIVILLVATLGFTGCSAYGPSVERALNQGPARLQDSPERLRLDAVPELDGKKITIAVYDFLDKTGQR